jgi:hypothetical protein
LCGLQGHVPFRIKNDYSFPAACTIRFQFAAKDHRPPLEIFWYDGSMKPPTPEELGNTELAPEGMLFVGDKGKILAGFLGEEPKLLLESQAKKQAPSAAPPRGQARREANALWVAACKGGPATYGDFRLAQPISDAFNLGAVSLRLGGKRLLFDSAQASITNLPEANKLLTREYRPGWELKA